MRNQQTKERILIIYHSGAGCTKFTADILASKLKENFETNIQHINRNFNYNILHNYDLLIVGFPTYHCEPSTSMMDFISQMPTLKESQKAFIFTSYALYTGNALRILHTKLVSKNIAPLANFQFRSPASDGVLMFSPHFKFMFRFEKKYNKHINEMITNIVQYKSLLPTPKPIFKWYVPFNEVVKYFGQKEYIKMLNAMTIITHRCTNCNQCISNCSRSCWAPTDAQPIFDATNCEFCLKCIHQCPSNAIIYSAKMRDKPRLNNSFFKEYRKTSIKPPPHVKYK